MSHQLVRKVLTICNVQIWVIVFLIYNHLCDKKHFTLITIPKKYILRNIVLSLYKTHSVPKMLNYIYIIMYMYI